MGRNSGPHATETKIIKSNDKAVETINGYITQESNHAV